MEKPGDGAVRLLTDGDGNLLVYPFAGFGIGTLPDDQIMLALGVFIPGLAGGPPGESRVQVRMTREHARRLGQALLFAADAVHIPDGKGSA